MFDIKAFVQCLKYCIVWFACFLFLCFVGYSLFPEVDYFNSTIAFTLLFAPPLIAARISPIRGYSWGIFPVVCKGIFVCVLSIFFCFDLGELIFGEDSPAIYRVFSLAFSILCLYLSCKNHFDSLFTRELRKQRRNPSILPAPPMQSPPPTPPRPQPRRYSIARVDAMEGHEFEHFTADLLRKLGYQRVEVTRGSGDQGVDVLAEKDGIKYAFQCKCYSSDLGNKPVQEVHAGKYIYQCHVGVVITNRYFTQGAKDAARATGILLWDRDKLREMMEAVAQ